jgi:hypothetical protein
MKRVVCVKSIEETMHKSNAEFTIGKTYELLPLSTLEDFYIMDDTGRRLYFGAVVTMFISLDEWRNNQLNKLGI